MKNKDNTQKEQVEGTWEAMSQIIVREYNKKYTRQLDTIRSESY